MSPLIDPDDLHSALPDDLPPGAPKPARVQGLIEEFIRVLGLLPVAIGRGEHVVAARGAGLLRDKLIDLMLEDAALPEDHASRRDHSSRRPWASRRRRAILGPHVQGMAAAAPRLRPGRVRQ